MKKIFTLLTLAMLCLTSAKAATYIKGTQVATIDRMYQFVCSKNASFDREIAEQFYKVGAVYGIRGDIALCQSIIETGWFKYTGGTAVTPSDHNYCGLGVTTLGQKGCIFSTVKEGVTAQIQHLYAYCCKDALPAGETLVDPRFKYVTRGCAPTWESLGGKWAASSSYGSNILSVYNQMMSFTVTNPKLTASSTDLTFNAEYNGTSPSKTITISGENLSSAIVYNASSSMFKVTTSNWDDYSGGKMTISIDTSKTPGTYTGYVAVQSGSGDSKKRVEIKITATITSPTKAYINVNPTSLSLQAIQGEANPTATITVSAGNLTADMIYNSSQSAFIVKPGSNWNARTGGTLIVSLDTSKPVGTYSGYVAIQTSSADRVTVNISGKILSSEFVALNLKEIWNYSLKRGNTTSAGYDAKQIRNFAYYNGKLYCVYNHAEIIILDARTGAKLGSLPLNDTVAGGTYKLCDVVVVDGHILACNLASSTDLRVYEWASDTSEPSLLLSTTNLQGATRVGDCMEAYGSLNGTLRLTFGNDDNTTTRIVEYIRTGSSWSTSCTKVTEKGSRYALGATVRAYYKGDGWWVDGKNGYPAWVQYDSSTSSAVVQCKNSYTGNTQGSSHREFYYNDQKYAANLIFAGSTNYTVPQMRLIIDNAGNFSNITAIGNYPSDGLSDGAENTGACGDIAVNTDGVSYVETWVLSYLQGICYYRSGSLPSTGTDPDPEPEPEPEPTPEPEPEPEPSGDLELPSEFSTVWEYSATKGNSTTFMDPSKDYTRNMVLKGNNLYVLQREDSDANIHIVDAATGTDKGNLPCSSIAAGSYKFFSVGNLGGTIVAASAALSNTSSLKVYAWSSDSSEPTTILETTNHGGRAGDLMSTYGDINNGKLYFASNSGYAGKIYVYTVTNGTANATPTIITLKDSKGNDFDLGGTYAVIEVRPQADGTLLCSGKGGATALFNADGTYIRSLASAATDGNTFGSCYTPFKFGKYTLAAAVTYKSGVQQGYLNLINATEGMENATALHSYGVLGASGVSNGTFVSTAIASVDGETINLWVLIPKQGIAKYKATGKYSGTTGIDRVDAPAIIFTGTSLEAEGAVIEIYTTSGLKVAAGSESVSSGNLAKGIYIVTATFADGTRKATKISIL